MDAAERPQLLQRTSNSGIDVPDIQLHDFIPGAPSCVLNDDADVDLTAGRQRWHARIQISISKRRVTQAITERVQRRVAKVHVSSSTTDVVVHHRRQLLE